MCFLNRQQLLSGTTSRNSLPLSPSFLPSTSHLTFTFYLRQQKISSYLRDRRFELCSYASLCELSHSLRPLLCASFQHFIRQLLRSWLTLSPWLLQSPCALASISYNPVSSPFGLVDITYRVQSWVVRYVGRRQTPSPVPEICYYLNGKHHSLPVSSSIPCQKWQVSSIR